MNSSPARKKLSLLIVDDSKIIVWRVRLMLEEMEGIIVTGIAESHRRAVEMIERDRPDVVLLDINLPDQSGIEVLKTVKHKYPGTKVIMFTNQADDYTRAHCLKKGADYFFDKSMDFDSVREILSDL